MLPEEVENEEWVKQKKKHLKDTTGTNYNVWWT